MSTGTVDVSFAPIGANLPDFDNYFCRDCRRIVHVRIARLPRVPDSGLHEPHGLRDPLEDAEALGPGAPGRAGPAPRHPNG